MFDMLVEPPPEPEPPDSVLITPPDPDDLPPEDLDDDCVSDLELDAAASAVWTAREAAELAAELSVDRLDADATLDRVELGRRRVNLAEVEQLDLAAHWADLNAVLGRPGGSKVAGERLVRLGGDGTPQVAEFAACELALALQVADGSAAALMADALDLRHRFRMLWDLIHRGSTPVWLARKTAQAARTLSAEAAGRVDEQISRFHANLTWGRLRKAVAAAILRADPPQAVSDAEQAAADAKVTWRPDEVEHGYGTMIIRAAAGDLEALHQALDLISRSMKILGDPGTADQRRAAATGILADPAAAQDLVARAEATRKLQREAAAARRAGDTDAADTADAKVDRSPLVFGNATLYYHLSRQAIQAILTGQPCAGAGVGRVEDIGPVIADQIRDWLGHSNVTVKPVIDLPGMPPVDRYEVPSRISEAIGLIYPADYSPYSTSLSRRHDMDHPIPYVPPDHGGPPGQTDPRIMGGLTRHHHRAKTHGGWTVTPLHPGAWLWRSPHGRYALVDHRGTTPLGTL